MAKKQPIRKYAPRKYTVSQRLEFYSIPEPNSGCWLWLGAHNSDGYGHLRCGAKIELAHRASWRVWRGDLQNNQVVCHRCDVPACVNPAHLFVGTQQDNIADMKNKKRSRGARLCGEKNPQAKLTENQIKLIRLDVRAQSKIATDYGISQSAISAIQRRASWKNV